MPAMKVEHFSEELRPFLAPCQRIFCACPSGLFIEHVQCEGDVEDDFFEQKHFTIGEEFFFPGIESEYTDNFPMETEREYSR